MPPHVSASFPGMVMSRTTCSAHDTAVLCGNNLLVQVLCNGMIHVLKYASNDTSTCKELLARQLLNHTKTEETHCWSNRYVFTVLQQVTVRSTLHKVQYTQKLVEHWRTRKRVAPLSVHTTA
jgi:hypothetical protein